jgi:alkanesulfonate monooxygenase SsuD/methylene tetrahydromethanopterin reductase-like flavin-dependent oxidoreductase (luciferase family)
MLGIGLTPLETRREVILHVARRAEELGYDAFWLAEGWGQDAGVLLAEVASQTDRIRIGTGVLNVWGRTPATVAMMATSLSEASGGRFSLGLGAGSPPLAEGFHDVPFDDPVTRLADMTSQVRRLLAGERIEQSRSSEIRPLKLARLPASEVPINLAALGPKSTRMAGQLADGWMPFLLPVSGAETSATLLDEGATAAGRQRPTIAPSVPVAVSADPAEALEIASWWVVFYLVSMGPLYRATLRRLGHGAAVDEVVAANPTPRTPDMPPAALGLLDELTVWGDPDAGHATLDKWYAAGAELPALTLPPGRDLATLDYMMESLAPR